MIEKGADVNVKDNMNMTAKDSYGMWLRPHGSVKYRYMETIIT